MFTIKNNEINIQFELIGGALATAQNQLAALEITLNDATRALSDFNALNKAQQVSAAQTAGVTKTGGTGDDMTYRNSLNSAITTAQDAVDAKQLEIDALAPAPAPASKYSAELLNSAPLFKALQEAMGAAKSAGVDEDAALLRAMGHPAFVGKADDDLADIINSQQALSGYTGSMGWVDSASRPSARPTSGVGSSIFARGGAAAAAAFVSDLGRFLAEVNAALPNNKKPLANGYLNLAINLLNRGLVSPREAEVFEFARNMAEIANSLESSSSLSDLLAVPSSSGSLWNRAANGDLQWVNPADPKDVKSLSQFWTTTAAAAGDGAGEIPTGAGGRNDIWKCFNATTNATIHTVSADDQCLGMISHPRLGANMNSEVVNQMSAEVVFGILKFLDFKMTEENGVNKIQSVNSWLSSPGNTAKLNDAHTRIVAGTFRVAGAAAPVGPAGAGTKWQNLNFVRNLVQFMNNNPAILNKTAAGSNATDGRQIGLSVAKARHNPKTDLTDYRVLIDTALNKFRFGINALMGMGQVGFSMYGGGMVAAGIVPSGRSPIDRLPEFTKQLKSLYQSFVGRLKSMKKTLSEHTRKQVEQVFDDCQKKEDEIKKLLEWFNAYSTTVRVTGSKAPAEYSAGDLESAHANFEKVMGKYRRRLSSILDISAVASLAVNDASNGMSLRM